MRYLLYILFFLPMVPACRAQESPAREVSLLIERLRNDIRGPYRDIRWFCTDGSIRPPKDPCPPEIGPGLQHARYKEEVEALGKREHIFLGQILAYTDIDAFWDENKDHSRLKQYQIEKYLRSVDRGWIFEKGQYYRGSVQAEDEEAWALRFYQELLGRDDAVSNKYFLIRQSLKDLSLGGDTNLAQQFRMQSRVISDSYPLFMELRIKIHGQPEASDLEKVREFHRQHANTLPPGLNETFLELEETLAVYFRPIDITSLGEGTSQLKNTRLGASLQNYMENARHGLEPALLIPATSELLLDIRKGLEEEKRAGARLQLLELSLKLETLIFRSAPLWEPESLGDSLDKICYLGMASAGAGYLELWEWEALERRLSRSGTDNLPLAELNEYLEAASSAVEWSAAMVSATYEETVALYSSFEPLASGFADERVRSGLPLHLGTSVGKLGDFLGKHSKLGNQFMGLPNQSSIRGLNPGYALGELVVVGGSPEGLSVAPDKIYVFQRAPSDLKPVAGIATVSEGNPVSHVQLLARNLGIPNAALSAENLKDLQKYNGSRVFYAVSDMGNIIMKPESKMSARERQLFSVKVRREERVEVPISRIRLQETQILDLSKVDAEYSGVVCGPKAANLGQLKKLFPDMVVDGLVIPFGIFREHMDLPMPGQAVSYWAFLNAMFREAGTLRQGNMPEPEVENYQLKQLAILREAIKKMPLKEEFLQRLEKEFQAVLGEPLGGLPVFLRSDTNMEDLEDFTGAGLNLTVFNVMEKARILNGIRDVWASPYTERSFKWRQKYLLNPENVYPSILLIPSVDVDYSGVLITKGVRTGKKSDLTIAFSRGAGGAVDGQAAETYVLGADGQDLLLAPAREPKYNRLPEQGGTERRYASFEEPILKSENREAIRDLARSIHEQMKGGKSNPYEGAYDVELGFKDNKLWLFQIRPFVENKGAAGSEYLQSISPQIPAELKIDLSTRI